MQRRKKLIIAILIVILLGLLFIIYGALFSGPDLTSESKDILVLCSDKEEQPNGGVDMAFMVHLENGSLVNYTPIYPGELVHPSQPAPGGLGGNMQMHDCLWDGVDVGSTYAQEIVESRLGMHSDAVVIVYDVAVDHIIQAASPLVVDGEVTNLSAAAIIRENDGYFGYPGNDDVSGNMSRGDAVMVLAKALSNATKDPTKKSAMIQSALDDYTKGNIIMNPQGSFTKLLATKGIENI